MAIDLPFQTSEETMEQVMKCGDLLTLKTLVERMKAVMETPWGTSKVPSYKNPWKSTRKG
jgi:hypothetical protein